MNAYFWVAVVALVVLLVVGHRRSSRTEEHPTHRRRGDGQPSPFGTNLDPPVNENGLPMIDSNIDIHGHGRGDTHM